MEISGWAVDPNNQVPARAVFIVVGSNIISQVEVSGDRPDVAQYYGDPKLRTSGWAVNIPRRFFNPGKFLVSAYALSSDGTTLNKISEIPVNVVDSSRERLKGIYHVSKSYTTFTDADYYIL